MTIHRLGPGDEELAEAAARLLLAEDDDGFPIDVEPFLASSTACALVSLAEDGAPTGWVYGHELVHPDGERTMVLYALDVDEGFRRQGRGRALVEAFVAEARGRGCTEVWVLTDDENPAALATYASAEGRREGRDAVMFTWPLAPGRESGEALS